MMARTILIAIAAVLLAGCSGWASESPLIPIAERDAIGLSGTYTSGDERLTFTASEDGAYRVTNAERSTTVAFDLLRADAAQSQAAYEVPDQTYLMEVMWEQEEGTIFFYDIVTITGGESVPSGSFMQYTVLCSDAAKAFALRVEDKVCIFNDYTRLRAAAVDALTWHDDARMAVETTGFQREIEADAMEPEDF